MVQFKGLILLLVVIISLKSLNSCVINNKRNGLLVANKATQMHTSDTLFLSSKDYKIVSLDNNM